MFRPIFCGALLAGQKGHGPLVLAMSVLYCAPSLPTEEEQILPGQGVRLETTWEYRYGDSPRYRGSFLWLQNEETIRRALAAEASQRAGPGSSMPGIVGPTWPPDSWHPLPFPEQPPNRMGREFIWQRVQLPEGQWRDPAIYIYSVDCIFEIYIDGKMIYKYGDLDASEPEFEGWPFHIVSLPADFSGKELYLRAHSDYIDIGIFHRVILDDRADLIEYILLSSLELIAIAGALLVIGGFSFLHF
jgi:hypothetical protein